MYWLILKMIPGPKWFKLIVFLIFIGIVLAVLNYIVFPWLNEFIELDSGAIE